MKALLGALDLMAVSMTLTLLIFIIYSMDVTKTTRALQALLDQSEDDIVHWFLWSVGSLARRFRLGSIGVPDYLLE